MAKVINLLPKPKQRELHYDSILHSLWKLVIWSCFSFALVFFVQVATKFYLQLEGQVIHDQIQALQQQVGKQQNSDVKVQITTANNLIKDYHALSVASPQWSKIINAFAPLPPSGIKINSFGVNTDTKAITITGLSPTRDLVIKLYNIILADQKDFYGIDYPLENVVSPTDDTFHFTFYVQNSLWKQAP
ncbi:MAG: hypothetical protein P4L74_03495 [Candidatus Doudnabacteria bacterium]|nr:hypothetical protein [Candidatus Doudnabacteria bacterium]